MESSITVDAFSFSQQIIDNNVKLLCFAILKGDMTQKMFCLYAMPL